MSEYIQALKQAGIIQKLRESLSAEDKLKFDEAVKEKIEEYNNMWLESQPMINEYQSKVNKYADKPEGEQGRNDEPTDGE